MKEWVVLGAVGRAAGSPSQESLLAEVVTVTAVQDILSEAVTVVRRTQSAGVVEIPGSAGSRIAEAAGKLADQGIQSVEAAEIQDVDQESQLVASESAGIVGGYTPSAWDTDNPVPVPIVP